MCKPYHYAIVEAVEPFKLHPTSMSYKYEVFEHLQLLCIDIWLHEIGGNWTTASYYGGLTPTNWRPRTNTQTHSVFITDVSPDLGEFAEILGDASVQTIPLCNG